ncbi:MAG TPA: hypothetical protein DCO80_07470 [Ornithinibacillus sp.]|nr:hypothetical protein [Ornithinibacillus sp.]
MFSNSAYSSIANGNDEYSARTITVASESTNMFKYAFDVYSEQMYRLLFMNNTFLNILLSIVCLIIINKSSKKTFKTSLLILFVSYSLYKPIVIDMLQVNIFGNYTNEFEAIYSILFFIGLVLTVFIYIDVPVLKNKILWYLLSILILSGPLLYAQPFGPRNFFTQYILFSIIVIELIYYIRSYLKIKLEPQVIRKTLIVSSIIVMSVYIFAFVQIRVSANERLEIIKQNLENNETQIQISKLPYSQFIWRGDPSQQQIRFKNLYKIPRDVELIEINYNDWIKK